MSRFQVVFLQIGENDIETVRRADYNLHGSHLRVLEAPGSGPCSVRKNIS